GAGGRPLARPSRRWCSAWRRWRSA
ncbi:MAG: hypothetical protein AVDCRST_MAG88-543, partial [uncultured Thermomicrobiales bacterium]